MYSRWKLSGWLVYDLGRLELTVIAGQFGLLCREAYRKVSKQASMVLEQYLVIPNPLGPYYIMNRDFTLPSLFLSQFVLIRWSLNNY